MNMGAEIMQLRLADFSIRAFKWHGNLGVAHVEAVEEWLVMDERGVIDVERDFADESERVFAIFVIEDAHVLCDQAPERVERQSADGSFDAALVQFFDHAVTPLPAKALPGHIQPTTKQGGDGKSSQQTQCAHKPATHERRCSVWRASERFRLFEDGRHSLHCYERRRRFQAIAALCVRRTFITTKSATVIDRRYSSLQ